MARELFLPQPLTGQRWFIPSVASSSFAATAAAAAAKHPAGFQQPSLASQWVGTVLEAGSVPGAHLSSRVSN